MEGAVGAFGRRRVIWQPNELISRTTDEELFFCFPRSSEGISNSLASYYGITKRIGERRKPEKISLLCKF